MLVLDQTMGRISPAVVSFQGSAPDGQAPVEPQIWVSRARVAKPGLENWRFTGFTVSSSCMDFAPNVVKVAQVVEKPHCSSSPPTFVSQKSERLHKFC